MNEHDAPAPESAAGAVMPAAAPASAWPRVGAALLVGALAGAAWFATQMPRRTPPPAVEAAAPPAEPASVPARDIASLLRTEPAVDAEPPAVPEGQLLVCGRAVDAQALSDERIAATLREAGAAQALERFAREKLTDDDHARAVGLVLRLQADAMYSADGYTACAARDDECLVRAGRAHAQRAAPLTAELAALANTTRDARVWTLARDQCSVMETGPESPAAAQCAQLSARRLVELERDNAVAWLTLAAEEPAAVDEALYQASIAARWDDHAMAARRFVERVDPKGGLTSLVVLQGLLDTPPLRSIAAQQVLLRECAAERLRADANRAQLCSGLAERLAQRATSVGALVTAATLGQSTGHAQAGAWRDRSRLFLTALNAAGTDAAAQERAAVECSLGLPRELLARQAREGEVAALRAWIDDSGQSDDQWLARAAAEEAVKLAASASAASSPR